MIRSQNVKPMYVFYFFLIATFLCSSCASDEETIISQDHPKVRSIATYEMRLERNLIYGKGLSHESINSVPSSEMPLYLDVYSPENDDINRPAFLFIHGGGFTGGSKNQSQILNLAEFYTSRGWVFVSINYRLRDDLGTVPQEWLDYSSTLPNQQVAQFLAIYPAQRDAKAAMRWLTVHAADYNINTDYITVGGGSAGAITALTLGISDDEDFRDELTTITDPTLSSTYINQSIQIHTIIDFWGSKVALDAYQDIYGFNRFDATNPPLFIAHGTEDPTVLYTEAEELKSIYEANNVPLVFYPLEGRGHGPWNAMVNGKRLEELAFDFIVEQQGLVID